MDDEKVDWSELPTELFPKIGTSLENKIDVLRFRSVCNSFRSSIPPSLPNTPSFPLQIPHPILYHTPIQTSTNLNTATVYRIEPSDGNSTSNLPPLAPASKGWLIKVEETWVDRDAVVECFKVYKLDEEWGTWVDVKNLGDRVFILGNSCSFSVSAKELTGYQRNCIYFTDVFGIRMFNLGDHRILPLEFDPCIDKTLFTSILAEGNNY